MCVDQVRVGRRIKHSIPVSAPVKNYLEKHYPNHYEVNKDDFLGMWCINALVRKTVKVRTLTNSPADLKYLQSRKFQYRWNFMVPIRYQDSIQLPKRRVLEFHNLIMKFIYTEILLEMESRRLKGDVNYIQSTIENFRDRYKIWDNDLEDDRIRKMYLRFREQHTTPDSELAGFLPGMLFGKI